MVEDFSKQDKRKITRPALPNLLFVPADEAQIRLISERLRQIEKVWRQPNSGDLIVIPDREVQDFMDRLDKREKKAKAIKTPINLGAAAEKDWFGLYINLFGKEAAEKRFGSKLQELKNVA